jgi:uncharacterized protein YjiS (DUF1127 family)
MQHHTHVGTIRLARQAVQAAGLDRILSLFEALRQGRRLRRTIDTLRALDDRTLADIGICRDDIEAVVRARARRP